MVARMVSESSVTGNWPMRASGYRSLLTEISPSIHPPFFEKDLDLILKNRRKVRRVREKFYNPKYWVKLGMIGVRKRLEKPARTSRGKTTLQCEIHRNEASSSTPRGRSLKNDSTSISHPRDSIRAERTQFRRRSDARTPKRTHFFPKISVFLFRNAGEVRREVDETNPTVLNPIGYIPHLMAHRGLWLAHLPDRADERPPDPRGSRGRRLLCKIQPLLKAGTLKT